MEKYKINSIEQLDGELILSLIQRFKQRELPRLNKLKRYYLGRHDSIINRTRPNGKPNNQIVNPFARHISKTATNYFIGVPVAYQSSDNKLMESLQLVFDDNQEQSQNTKLATDASIYGISYELLYIDDETQIKFDKLDATETFMIYDNTIKQNTLAAVRFYTTYDYTDEQETLLVEVYTTDSVFYYVQDDDNLRLTDEKVHYFGAVPVLTYYNNLEQQGDFETVLSLLDAYDKLQSDSVNNLEEFADSYLVISGATLDEEQAATMKDNRLINIDGQDSKEVEAYWLTKNSEPSEIEALKNRVVNDIFTFSSVPNFNDTRFNGSETSGSALRYKILSLENLIAEKKNYFEHGLTRRNKLICNFLNLKGQSYDYTDIQTRFTKNLAKDVESLSKMAQELTGIVSHKTRLSMLPFVENAEFELELLKQEEEDNIDSHNSYDFPVGNQVQNRDDIS